MIAMPATVAAECHEIVQPLYIAGTRLFDNSNAAGVKHDRRLVPGRFPGELIQSEFNAIANGVMACVKECIIAEGDVKNGLLLLIGGVRVVRPGMSPNSALRVFPLFFESL